MPSPPFLPSSSSLLTRVWTGVLRPVTLRISHLFAYGQQGWFFNKMIQHHHFHPHPFLWNLLFSLPLSPVWPHVRTSFQILKMSCWVWGGVGFAGPRGGKVASWKWRQLYFLWKGLKVAEGLEGKEQKKTFGLWFLSLPPSTCRSSFFHKLSRLQWLESSSLFLCNK